MQIYAVNLTASDTVKGAKAFAKEFGFDFPVLLDKEGKVAKLYHVAGIPTSYIIGKDGIIVDRLSGFGSTDELEDEFRKLVKSEY